MELVLGIIIIFVLMLCMGASIGFIASLALILVGVSIVFMAGFFVYATIIMATSKKAKGCYTRSEASDKGKIPYAVYLIDGNECKNMLPLEVMFQNKIYQTNKEVSLLFNKKRHRCFDTNAIICCILGIIVSCFLLFEIVVLLLGNLSL